MTRVLVVDDEPGLRQSIGLLLADAGYDVAAEGNGTRALERARAESFDVVLCDVRMPDMDGLAFLRAYKAGGGTALVIMMSAYGGEEAALAAMKEGAYDYVPSRSARTRWCSPFARRKSANASLTPSRH